jgi:hypothetical protein
MNESLIRTVVEYKLRLAGKVLDRLPGEVPGRVRQLGAIVYQTLGAHLAQAENEPAKNQHDPGKIRTVSID